MKLWSRRLTPIKQGYLYKKSHVLSQEWKKKYNTLLDDGRLTYHPSLHVSITGKEVTGGEKIGRGLLIPIKQDYLYKKSRGLNKS